MNKTKLFQKNLKRWEIVCPAGAKNISNLNCSKTSLCHSSSGALNIKLTNPEDGTSFFLHSEEDPIKEAKEWFEKLNPQKEYALYVFGVGLGYYYDAAREWLSKDPKHCLIFLEHEPEIIHRLLETERGTELLKNSQVMFFLVDDKEPSCKIDQVVAIFSLYLNGTYALKSYQEKYEKVFQDLKSKIDFFNSLSRSSYAEYSSHGLAFFRNFFLNTLMLPGSYLGSNLFGKFQGVPAIICGAGPSLNKNLEVLATLHDRAIIFAGGTAMNGLNTGGVLPHFGVGIDPNPDQFTRLVANHAYEVPFLYRSRMLTEAVELIHGDRMYIPGTSGYQMGNWFYKEIGVQECDVEEGFNVLNFSLNLARLMGCSPIFCVGIDLAYSNGKSYADGILVHPVHNRKGNFRTKQTSDDLIEKADIYGKPIYTLWKWVAESFWYANFALHHPEVVLVNATEGGIGFPGVANFSLKDGKRILLTKQYDIAARIHGEIQNSDLPLKADSAHIVDAFEKLEKSLESCMSYCIKIANLFERRMKEEKIDKKIDAQYNSEIKKSKDLLEKEFAYSVMLRDFTNIFRRMSNLNQTRILLDEGLIPEIELRRKKYNIEFDHYTFLKQTADLNFKLLKDVLNTYRTSQETIHKWKKQAENEYLPNLRKNHPLPVPSPEEKYSFENNVLTIIEPEINLNFKEKFDAEVEKTDYPNGSIKTVAFYKNRLLHGPSTFYGQDGVLLAQTWFIEGQRVGKQWTRYASGALHSLQRFFQGNPEGTQLYFYPDGLPKSIIPYKNKKMDGEVSLYFSNGILGRRLTFREGKRYGLEQIWDERGTLRIEAHYEADKPVGIAKTWFANGVLGKEVTYDEESNCIDVKNWDAKSTLKSSDKDYDFYDEVFKQTDKLTNSLDNVLMNMSKVVPMISNEVAVVKNNSNDLPYSKDLEALQKEMEKLHSLNQQLHKEMSSTDINSSEEAIWKTPDTQSKMEEQLKLLQQKMNTDIGNIEEHLKKALMHILKKQDPPL